MNILRKVSLTLVKNTKTHIKPTHLRQLSSLYEPDYLDANKSKTPLYDTINIQLRGYDYPILESYQKYLHNLISNMDISVEECWASPAQHMQISTYKPTSDLVQSQIKLKIYERTIQVTDVTSLQMPILLRVLESSAPAGVTIQVVPHEEWHEQNRYIPDSELKQLKEELDELGGPTKKK